MPSQPLKQLYTRGFARQISFLPGDTLNMYLQSNNAIEMRDICHFLHSRYISIHVLKMWNLPTYFFQYLIRHVYTFLTRHFISLLWPYYRNIKYQTKPQDVSNRKGGSLTSLLSVMKVSLKTWLIIKYCLSVPWMNEDSHPIYCILNHVIKQKFCY